MKARVMYIHDTTSSNRYRREVLRKLLGEDGRFELTSISTPTSIDEGERIFDTIEAGGWDILLASDPHWVDDLNSRAVASVAMWPGKLMVYDLSDNWQDGGKSERLMELSDMVGCSARYLYQEAKKHCPTVGFYPNGKRASSITADTSFSTDAKYVYCGQLRKLDLTAIDMLLSMDEDAKVDVYANDYAIRGEEYKKQVDTDRVRILEKIHYKTLLSRLPSYKVGLCTFVEDVATVNGMLPDKLFDYCLAELPVIYGNCNELSHSDFRSVAFDIYGETFSLEQVKALRTDFAVVCRQYDMSESLKRFIDDMHALWLNEGRPKAMDKKWHAPWDNN